MKSEKSRFPSRLLQLLRRRPKRPLTLTPRACLLLKYLLEHAGESFSYQELTNVMPWNSKSTTYKHVKRLKELGLIESDTTREATISAKPVEVILYLRRIEDDRINSDC